MIRFYKHKIYKPHQICRGKMNQITNKIFTILITFLFVTNPVSAEDFFSKEDFSIAVGGQADSQIHKRGIITYGGYQALPVFAVTLFNPDLILAGSTLYYKHELIEDQLYIRTRFNIDATGDEPLYFTSEDEDDRVRRETTAEFDFYLEYLFPNESFLRLNLSQDLVAHKGSYIELRARLALYDFLKEPGGKALIQPGLFVAAGYGDASHNEYFYGLGADVSGFNNIEYGLSVTSPKVIDLFWPTFQVTHFQLLGDQNKNGSFVQENDGWSVQLLFAFKVY